MGKRYHMREESIVHPIPPLYDENCKILILGSFPSVKSREAMFFYGHPQNRFWKLMAALFEEAYPQTIEEKKALVLKHHIAMWDTIRSCTITGSSDSSIKDVVPNDLSVILDNSRVERIFCNGATSYRLYMKYIYPTTGVKAVKLPSTSPANAAFNLERLLTEWSMIKD
ncbi:MAG: DNA-deoxyinosine glycosylase [Ruminococcus sp.]|nr:DNA-deoxyinosine glycosylase [Ruminococcus sp.]MBQ1898928.1 DNA-deoxyinosine glycosylase [Ruminococcus sp.]MBQ6413817.1 DNA-deoxyinosine glycosylase [Ruminococcus sp.]